MNHYPLLPGPTQVLFHLRVDHIKDVDAVENTLAIIVPTRK